MATNKKYYSSSDIQRYASGHMPAEEMNALEKAALEDPFFSDAMEGYIEQSGRKGQDAAGDIEELKRRLNNRVNEEEKAKAVSPFKWWKIAAIFILLAGAGGLIYSLNKTDQDVNPTLAKNESDASAQPLEDSTTEDIISLNEPASGLNKKDTSLVEQPLAGVAPGPARESKKAKKQRPDDQEQDFAVAGKPALRSSGMKNRERLAQESLNNQISGAPKMMAPSTLQNENVLNSFSGKVVDDSNRPVFGASVIVLNSELGLATDSNGYFNFSFKDSTATVAINTIGFKPASATLKADLSHTEIRLRQSTANLNEIVVTGYGSARKKASTRISSGKTNTGVEPVIGWVEYERYIEKNKKIPAGQNSVHGEILLSFRVDKKGRPVQLQVEKPLSPNFDAEAVRLVKEGPRWKVVNNQTKATITIRF